MVILTACQIFSVSRYIAYSGYRIAYNNLVSSI